MKEAGREVRERDAEQKQRVQQRLTLKIRDRRGLEAKENR